MLSDIDWIILIAVIAFFFVGRRNERLLHQIGRYYGRLVSLKNEAMAEVTAGAGLPLPGRGGPASIRQYLMSDAFGSSSMTGSGIPAAVTSPPQVIVRHTVEPFPYAQYQGLWTWSVGEAAPSFETTEAR